MATTTTPADDLPSLTQIESDAAIAVAWGDPGACMLQIAAKLKLAPGELKEILQRPHVVIFTQAARELQQMRDEIVIRRNHADALHNLVTIAQDPDNTVETRLHASIAVLRGVRDGPAPSTRATPKLRQDLRPATAPRLALPAPPRPPGTTTGANRSRAPTAPEGPSGTPTAPGGPAGTPAVPGGPSGTPTVPGDPSGTPTVPGGSQPDQHANNKPTLDPTSALRPTLSNHPATTRSPSPITLHHAAGAPLPRRAAPPPAPDRPP